MAYSKRVLENYGANIEDEGLRAEFRARIQTLVFTEEDGCETAPAGAVRRVLGTELEHLIRDLAKRHVRF